MTVTNRAARAGDRVVEGGLQPPDLVGPADERSGVGGLRLAAEPLVHRDRRGPPLHLHLAEGLVAVSAARRSPRLLADDDVAARALGLEPGADVQARRRRGRRRRRRPRPHRCSPRPAGRVRHACVSATRAARSTNRSCSSTAASTAWPASSGPISGTPQTAMNPSPMYFVTPARWRSAVERRRSWYRSMTSRAVSASTCSSKRRRTGQIGEHDGHGLARRGRQPGPSRARLTVERRATRRGRIARSRWLPPRRSRRPAPSDRAAAFAEAGVLFVRRCRRRRRHAAARPVSRASVTPCWAGRDERGQLDSVVADPDTCRATV